MIVKKIIKRLLPPGTIGFRLAQATGRLLHLLPPATSMDGAYNEWIKDSEPQFWEAKHSFTYEPLISIVVPVFNAPDYYLLPMVYSITNQKYSNWELVLVNASTDSFCRKLTEDCTGIDSRIKVVDLEKNGGIAYNTNQGLAACTGEYVALLDHDDLFAPHALAEVVAVLQGSPAKRPQFIYSDEDKLSEDGDYRFDPHFKPAWSPTMLQGVNYLNHLTVIERSLVTKIGGYQSGVDGAQDYDLYLRILDEKPRVMHIPKVLYHWRAAKNSTAQNFSIKKGVTDSGECALSNHLQRNGWRGRVKSIPKKPGFYSIVYDLPKRTKASIIILPAHDQDRQRSTLKSLLKYLSHNEASVEIVTPATGDKVLDGRDDVRLVDESEEFLAKALAVAKGDFVIAIQAGLVPKTKRWIDQLGGLVCQVKEIGIASPLLIDGASGMVLDSGYAQQGSQLQPLFELTPPGLHTYFGNNDWPREVDALSGRIWVARTDVAKKYANALTGSVNFDKVIQDGLRIVFWPHVSLKYFGELCVSESESLRFNNRLRYSKGNIVLPRTTSLSVQRSDENG